MRLLLLIGLIAQVLPGLWFPDKPVRYSGLVQDDAITFSIPVEDKLPAGTYVQFGVSLENEGDGAPRHYIVEVQQGNSWICLSSPVFHDGLSNYSFITVPSKDKHPSTYIDIFRLTRPVTDSLRIRCRVNSPYNCIRGQLSRNDASNCVQMKAKYYVGARMQPLGKKRPSARKKVLMIGNSFTYFYGVPLMLQEIAFSQGLELDINASLKGGQSFRDHSKLVMTMTNCSMETYDYAFLQGQSQEPAVFATDMAVHRDIRFALCDLCDVIRSLSPDCNIYVENTWAYGSGNCGGFGSLEKFDELLAQGTAKIATASRSNITPVGQAFAAVRAEGNPVNLLGNDDKHQSLAGSYLKACVEYLVISGKPFKGEVPSCGLSATDASYLRKIAEKTVLK